jgi:hypothetical protein
MAQGVGPEFKPSNAKKKKKYANLHNLSLTKSGNKSNAHHLLNR